MSAISDATKTVLSCLRTSEEELTAADIRKKTKLPLPVVTRALQTIANELVSPVERKERDDRVYYLYIGPKTDESNENLTRKIQAGTITQTTAKKRESLAPKKKIATLRTSQEATPTPPSSPSPAPAPIKLAPRVPRVDLKLVYKLIGDHLKLVPMNITRLSNETGISQQDLVPALQELTKAGLITQKEMLEDVVYRSVGDLRSKIDLMEISSDTPPQSSDEMTEILADQEDAVRLLNISRSNLEESTKIADAFIGRGNELSDKMRVLIADMSEWRESLQRFLNSNNN